jgi:hypothetical protein
MKLEDMPTPESDAAKFISEYITQEDAVPYGLSQSLEQRLAIAVAALESVAGDSEDRFIRGVARAALTQIEKS